MLTLAPTAWYACGGTLLATAVGLLGWALLWDRARGRARCPGCWYSMEGAAGTEVAERPRCPECGRIAHFESSLFRTRRRWRWAGLGLLTLYAGVQLALVPTPGREGWWRFAPTFALAIGADYAERSDPLTAHLAQRLEPGWGFAFPWDRWLARRLELRNIGADWSGVVRTRPRWMVGAPVRVKIDGWGNQWLQSVGDWRTLEMRATALPGPVAETMFAPVATPGGCFFGPLPPNYLDLPPPRQGLNTYALDLRLLAGSRVLAQRTVTIEVEGVADPDDILAPVEPPVAELIQPTLRFSFGTTSLASHLYVEQDHQLWQPATYARCFLVRLWDGQALLSEAPLSIDAYGANLSNLLEDPALGPRLREGGRYLDISGLELELLPDPAGALQELSPMSYSTERFRIPLQQVPFRVSDRADTYVTVEDGLIPLTDRAPQEWLSRYGLANDQGEESP